MRESASVTQMELAKAVAATAEQVARDTATTQKWRWMAGGIAASAVAVLAAVGFGYGLGRETARAEAAAVARDAAGAATWAATPDGQLAYRWARTGELQRLARCGDQTLTRERQQGRAVCLAKKGSGWWLP